MPTNKNYISVDLNTPISKLQDGGSKPSLMSGLFQKINEIKETVKEDSKEKTRGSLIFGDKDLIELNNSELACKDGACLERAWNTYDNLVASYRPDEFPSSQQLKENWGVQSMLGGKNISPEQRKELEEKYPYFVGDEDYLSMDSWDTHGVMVDNGGVNLFTANKYITERPEDNSGDIYDENAPTPKQKYYTGWEELSNKEKEDIIKQTTIGTVVGYGNKSAGGYNKSKGLFPSSHSAIVVGYAEDGIPIVYDFTTFKKLDLNSDDFRQDTVSYTHLTLPTNREV